MFLITILATPIVQKNLINHLIDCIYLTRARQIVQHVHKIQNIKTKADCEHSTNRTDSNFIMGNFNVAK